MQECATIRLPGDEDKVLIIRPNGFFRRKQRIYIGNDKLDPTPARQRAVDREWEKIQKECLDEPIVVITGLIGGHSENDEQKIEGELRITCYGESAGSLTVPLVPTVWLRCANPRARNIAKEQVRNVDITSSWGLRGKIEVSLKSEAPSLAAVHSFPIPAALQLRLDSQQGFDLPR